VGMLWLGLILFLCISSIFSHSLPLSLDNIVFYASSFCIFIFFKSLGLSKIFSKSQIAATFLLVGFVLSMFFILFFSFPETSEFLPPVNFFTTHYGHNHFAALLLFLIPLSWWFISSSEYKFFAYRKSILVLFYTLIIFSFGRFATLLTIIQLFFIPGIINKKFFKKIYLYLVGIILASSLVIGAMVSLNSVSNCLVNEFKIQLCKPITNEARPEYFKQAVRSLKAYPLFGYGPGSFSLISKRFNTTSQSFSIYAHNNFLQIFSESGVIVGIIYVLLIGLLYKNMFSVLKKSKDGNRLNSFLYLGLVSLLINSFIDFDWELFPIFQMVIIFIAVVLWDYQGAYFDNKRIFLVLKKSINYFLFFLMVMLIGLGFINFVTKILINGGNEEITFRIFPYFYSQSEFFLTEADISEEQTDLLYKIYENHDKFILNNIEKEPNIDKKIELYKKLMVVRLYDVTNTNYYQLLLDQGMYVSLGEASYKGLSMLIENENNGMGQSYIVKENIINYLLLSAHWHEENGEYDLYKKYYDFIESIWNKDWSN